ncbi:class I SAM-dependent methyltransferase [Candidatus Saccharibacteria bacterium]|nr:class I SAM-dependent methyltransferase [Candidatus Saccharibacteria bacterium]MBI3338308.1 class I SAM-dependent methyltransferase [Candidatus Saccharibacteria bacterium]
MSERSEAYAAFAEGSYSWRFIERPALDRAIPASAYSDSTKILDIGSGSGRVIGYHIARGAVEANVTGVDPDHKSVELSSNRFPQARFIEQKIQDIELEDASLDIVSAQLSLRYLDNTELATLCGKVALALRGDGMFFLLDVHPTRYGVSDGFDKYFQEGLREVDTPWGGSETYFYRTLGTYVTTLSKAGLRIVSLDECPVTQEGMNEAHSKDFARYSMSPARFAILAAKSV